MIPELEQQPRKCGWFSHGSLIQRPDEDGLVSYSWSHSCSKESQHPCGKENQPMSVRQGSPPYSLGFLTLLASMEDVASTKTRADNKKLHGFWRSSEDIFMTIFHCAARPSSKYFELLPSFHLLLCPADTSTLGIAAERISHQAVMRTLSVNTNTRFVTTSYCTDRPYSKYIKLLPILHLLYALLTPRRLISPLSEYGIKQTTISGSFFFLLALPKPL